MRLSTIPGLPQGFVSCLEENAIRSDTDFLSTKTVDILRLLPPGIVTLAQIKQYKNTVIECSAASGLSARSLFESTLSVPFHAEIGLPRSLAAISHLLSAHSGRVVELSGGRDVRKSEFVLNVVLRFLSANVDHSAFWVDTTGEFSLERASRVASFVTGGEPQSCLEQMQLSLALGIEDLFGILDGLASSAAPENGAVPPKTGFLIIDNITSILGPLLSATSSQGHAFMMSLMRQLRVISQTCSITVIVINNNATSLPGVERKPALGQTFTFLTDATLWLATSTSGEAEFNAGSSSDGDRTIHSVSVLKSSVLATNIRGSYVLQSGLYVLPDL